MLKKNRMLLISTLLLLISMAVAACGNPTGGNGGSQTSQQTYNYKTPPNKGGTVLYSDWQFPSSTNLWFNTDVVGVEVASALWGAPLAATSDGKLIPDELTEVPSVQNGDVSKDGLTVTMKINPNLKWSDGQPITADDFIYWWTVNEDPASGAASTSGFDQIDTMTATDSHTLVLHYKQIFAPFLFFLPN